MLLQEPRFLGMGAISLPSTRIGMDIHSPWVMQTIAILPELSSNPPTYRAICGSHQVTGQTPGQALDRLENVVGVIAQGDILTLPRSQFLTMNEGLLVENPNNYP
jgi:hypothetical protein